MAWNSSQYRYSKHVIELEGCVPFNDTYTRTNRPQTNGKIEAFFKIVKKEFFYPNKFESGEDVILNLGNFLFVYNHLRRHGELNYETPFDKLQKVTKLVS
ncbi:MAG: integrase core domain-containing protein [Thermodesulfobacteriota bacterium]